MMVGREGIEPPQSKTADLQSAELTTCSTYPRKRSCRLGSWWGRRSGSSVGADDGTRTRNRRFTKPLLYQLSYVGARRGTRGLPQRPEGGRPRGRSRRSTRAGAPAAGVDGSSASRRRRGLSGSSVGRTRSTGAADWLAPARGSGWTPASRGGRSAAALAGGLEQQDRARDGGVERADRAPHGDPDEEVAAPADWPARPRPSLPTTIASGPRRSASRAVSGASSSAPTIRRPRTWRSARAPGEVVDRAPAAGARWRRRRP